MSNSRGWSQGTGEGGVVPKNRFLGVEFSFSPQPDTADTEEVEGRWCRNFSRTQVLDLECSQELSFP